MNEQRVDEFVLDERRHDFVSLFSQLTDHAGDVDVLGENLIKIAEDFDGSRTYLVVIEGVKEQVGYEGQPRSFSFIAVNHHGWV